MEEFFLNFDWLYELLVLRTTAASAAVGLVSMALSSLAVFSLWPGFMDKGDYSGYARMSAITWGNFGYPREAGNTSVCFNPYYFKIK